MDYEDVVCAFNRRIRMEQKDYSDLENRPSYWRKKIFVNSFDLKISDWKGVRRGDYYDKRDSLKGIERDKFIYNRIIEYKLKTKTK